MGALLLAQNKNVVPQTGEFLISGMIFKTDAKAKRFSMRNLTILLPGKQERDHSGNTEFSWDAATKMFSYDGKPLKFDAKKLDGKWVRVIVKSGGESEIQAAARIVLPKP